jgi:serine/threonine-protein kinase
VLKSPSFATSHRLQRFLRCASERVLAADGGNIKEYQLGVEVFERGVDFDPKTDSIVRVEASRLRHKLREYYETEGKQDELRIELPKGTYTPVFQLIAPLPVQEAPRPSRRWAWRRAGGSAVLGIAALILLAARDSANRRPAAANQPGLNCIAVLPFENLSAGADNERLTDGFVEELTNRFARFGELRVGSILEGSVRRDGDHLDLTVELISANDGYHLWSDRFESQGLDGTEDEVLMGVLRAIKVSPAGGLEGVLHRGTPPDPEAHRLYLEARVFWNQRTYEALQQALALYALALKIDPHYAPAEAGIAACYGVIAANGLADTRQAAALGKAAAQRAIALDDTVAEAHAALGLIRSVGDWDWTGAEEAFRKAIALNPNYASAYQWRAHNLLWQARFREAREQIEKARDLDSLSLVILSNQAEFAYFMRSYEESLRLYDQVLALDPSFISATIERGMVLQRLRRYPEAIASFQKALGLTKEEASPLVGLAITYGLEGNAAAARPALSQLERSGAAMHVSNFQLAAIYASLGDVDRGIAALEKSYQERDSFLFAMKVHPDLDPLRGDARFQELLRRMRLE